MQGMESRSGLWGAQDKAIDISREEQGRAGMAAWQQGSRIPTRNPPHPPKFLCGQLAVVPPELRHDHGRGLGVPQLQNVLHHIVAKGVLQKAGGAVVC